MSRRPHREPTLLLPARVDAGERWVACSGCRALHPQPHDERDLRPGAPRIPAPRCPHGSAIARRLSARVVIVEGVDSDAELLALADDLLLAFYGWALDDDGQYWSHPLFGLHDAPAALAVQRGLDALASHQLTRLDARC